MKGSPCKRKMLYTPPPRPCGRLRRPRAWLLRAVNVGPERARPWGRVWPARKQSQCPFSCVLFSRPSPVTPRPSLSPSPFPARTQEVRRLTHGKTGWGDGNVCFQFRAFAHSSFGAPPPPGKPKKSYFYHFLLLLRFSSHLFWNVKTQIKFSKLIRYVHYWI